VAATARLVPALIAAAALAACATPRGPVSPPVSSEPERGRVETGYASWYGRWHHGRRTTSGEIYDMNRLTAAHPSLPLGTRVRVTNLRNGRSVEVRVNDRGPAVDGRILDLSYAAARALDAVGEGVVPVRLRVVAIPPP
jgi:rare lipoprotein A